MRRMYKRLALGVAVLLLLVFAGYALLHRSGLLQVCPTGLTLADFESVHLGMTLDEISEKLGDPKTKTIYMYEYELVDGDRVILRMPGEVLKGAWILRGDGTRTDFFTREVLSELDLEDFGFLEPGIAYDEVIRRVGEPHLEMGSGLHIAIYELADDREVTLMLDIQWVEENIVDVVADAWVYSVNGNLVHFFE